MTQIREALNQSLRQHVAANHMAAAWGGPLSDEELDDPERRRIPQTTADGRLNIEALRNSILAKRRRYNPHVRAPRQRGPSPERIQNRKRRLLHETALRELLVLDAERDARDSCGVHAYRR